MTKSATGRTQRQVVENDMPNFFKRLFSKPPAASIAPEIEVQGLAVDRPIVWTLRKLL
jgi:hypothetical protein